MPPETASCWCFPSRHYNDIIMSAMVSQITSLTTVYWTVYSDAENIKASRHWPLWGEFTGEFPHQESITRKMFPFDDVIAWDRKVNQKYSDWWCKKPWSHVIRRYMDFWSFLCAWFNSLNIEAEWRIYPPVNYPSLVQIMACRLVGDKPFSEPVLEYCRFEP